MSNQLQITGGAKVRSLEGVITGTSGVLGSVPLGAANGVATLDSGGKVPVSQLPSSVVTYLGTWNAATNTPTLVNGVGDAGDMYICNVAGTVNFGAGPVTFAVGDWVLYGSGTWQKSNGQNGTVTSVGASITGNSIGLTGSPITTAGTLAFAFAGTSGQYVNGAGNLTTFPTLITSIGLSMPSAFSVANSPLTANGSINVTGAGTVSQYIDGTGALQTFPALTGYVPYTGATADVDLGTHVLNAQALHVKGTAGAGHLGLKHQTATSTGSANESLIFADVNGNLGWLNGNLYLTTLVSNANTANRSYTFPNASGTLALTSDISYPVTSVFGRTGAVTAQSGDYTTTLVTEGTNLYYTDARARAALSFTAGSGAYNSTTGVITIPTNTNQLTNGANFITLASLSAGTGISYNNTTGVISSTITQYTDAMARAAISGGTGISYNSTTGVITNTITQYTDALARAAISLTTTGTSGAATYNSTTGVLNIPQYTDAYVGTVTSVGLSAPTGFSVSGSPVTSSGTLALAFAAGYSLPTNVKQSNWDDAYTWVAAFPTQTGNNGKFLTTNGSVLSWADNPLGTVTSVAMTVPTGLSVSGTPITTSGTLAVTLTAGYSIPTTASQTNWDTAYTNRITSATSPLSITSNVISISQATTSTSGYLSSTDWNTFNNKGSGTVTSVAALTLGTIGTDLSSSVATGTTTPVITLNVPTASATNRGALSSADWSTFNAKQSALTFSSPLVNTSGTISIPVATTSVNGYLSSTDWTTFNNKQGALTLTTTGTSGAATLVGNTLNIPQYSGGGGSISLSAIGSSPNANAATLTGSVLNLEPASASFGGVVTTGTQTFAGQKTFSPSVTASGAVARGTILSPTLVAAANSDVLSAVYINPTFTNGAFTGVLNYALNAPIGNVLLGTAPATDAKFIVSNTTSNYAAFISSPSLYAGSYRLMRWYTNGNIIMNIQSSNGTDLDMSNQQNGYIDLSTNSGQGLRLTSGNSLGIGTTTIGSKLQVNGNVAIGYSASTAAPTNGLAVSGNVGIGLSSAASKLHVSASYTAPTGGIDANVQILTSNTSTGSSSGLNMLASNTGVSFLHFGDTDKANQGEIAYTHVNDNMLFVTAANIKMRLDGSGNLGLNTSTINSKLQISPDANQTAIGITGYSLTGTNAQSLLDLAGTWNTTGNPTAIKLNITNTASGATSNLMDLQVGGVSKFKIDKAGSITTAGFGSTTAQPWKLGQLVTATVTGVNLTGYITIEVNGTQYNLALANLA